MAEALLIDTGASADGAVLPHGSTRVGPQAAGAVVTPIVHLSARAGLEDAPWARELSESDERLRRRERLLHHLEMERQRRRRRSA